MKKLLSERKVLFTRYRKLREELLGAKAVTTQMQRLSGLIASSISKSDTTVRTSEKKITTTLPAFQNRIRRCGPVKRK